MMVNYIVSHYYLVTPFPPSFPPPSSSGRAKLAPSLVKPFIGGGSGPEKDPNQQGVELAVPGQKPSGAASDKPARKPPSHDAPLRWAAVAVFGGITVPIMIALIVLIAI